jgi:hypothetical protein
LKKRSKKLLIILASACPDRRSQGSQEFFGSFFQKRTAFCPLPLLGVLTFPLNGKVKKAAKNFWEIGAALLQSACFNNQEYCCAFTILSRRAHSRI